MRLRFPSWPAPDAGEHIATFGGARLVKQLNGRFELRGGTADDHRAAKEWCSLFMHEVTLPPVAKPLAQAAHRHHS